MCIVMKEKNWNLRGQHSVVLCSEHSEVDYTWRSNQGNLLEDADDGGSYCCFFQAKGGFMETNPCWVCSSCILLVVYSSQDCSNWN